MKKYKLKSYSEIPYFYKSITCKIDGYSGVMYWLDKEPTQEEKQHILDKYNNVKWLYSTSEYAPEQKHIILFVSTKVIKNEEEHKMPNIYNLEPQFDSRKSFYGKAQVINNSNGIIQLKSYSTIVAEIDTKHNKAVVYGTYSATTLRHIKEFLLQHGYKAVNKSQILGDYGI